MKLNRKDLDFLLAQIPGSRKSSGFAEWQKLVDYTVILAVILNHLPDCCRK